MTKSASPTSPTRRKAPAASDKAATAVKAPARRRATAPAKTAPTTTDAAESVRAFAREYPFAVLVGGIALGALAGAVMPRAAARRLTKGAIAVAGIAGELGLLYGKQAIARASEAAEALPGAAETVGTNAADYSRKAAGVLGDVLSTASATAREASHKIGRQAIRLRSHLRH
ncbi:hypothetical protein H7F51_04430 [Novosphingobium flavum]|uniref:Uncharacterized protein n=1 Tax=Novosphingobium flavum TaxID=1778672 RepID=A0A7X1FPU9_9SPHN|nr:hypothetical protein [Novosphingobium flavum]MBC2664761.1 hypothetical protein [Novosphingobium flavum]